MLIYVMAGAFRLARFNLSACEGKPPDTTGLTISTSGAFVTLAVMADLSTGSRLLPDWAFIPLLPLIAVLMASRLGFPEFNHMIRHRRASLGVLGGACVLSLFVPFVVVWFGATTVYISFALGRAVVRSL
jgi:phosphatidylserine synthase